MKRYIRSDVDSSRNAFELSGQTPAQAINTWYKFLVNCGLNKYLNQNNLQEGQDYTINYGKVLLSRDIKHMTYILSLNIDVVSTMEAIHTAEVWVSTPSLHFDLSVKFEYSKAIDDDEHTPAEATAVGIDPGEYSDTPFNLSRLDPNSLNSTSPDIGYVSTNYLQTNIAEACNVDKFSEQLSIMITNFARWYTEAKAESYQYRGRSSKRGQRNNYSDKFTSLVAVADQYPYDIDANMSDKEMIDIMEDNGKPYFRSVDDAFEALYESTGGTEEGVATALRAIEYDYGNSTTPPVITYMLGDNYSDQQAGYLEWLSIYKEIDGDFE